MKIPSFQTIVPGAVLGALLLGSVPSFAQVTAVPADEFLNSLGINTHIAQGYPQANYATPLLYTGIRNIRDAANGGNATPYLNLHNTTGVKVTVVGGANTVNIINTCTALATADALLAIEGPNEPNNFPITFNGVKGGGLGLPPGLAVKALTGVISGTPTTSGTWAIGLNAINTSGTGRGTLTIMISNGASGKPVIVSPVAAAASTSGSFTYQILATNNPTSFNATGLPPGLAVEPSSGYILGTPTGTGNWCVSLSAVNASGTGAAYLAISVNANAAVPVVTSPAVVTGTVGSPFTYQIAATNSPTKYGAVASWIPVALAQRDMYAAVKASPTLASYPVFHVSEGGAENDNVGMQWLTIPAGADCLMPEGTQYADYANPHNYVCGTSGVIADNQAWNAEDPTLNSRWDGLFDEYGVTWNKKFKGYSNAELLTLPRVTSETGWATGGDVRPVTEEQQGKLYLNLFLSAVKRGWKHTFIYQMRDGEGGDNVDFGIYHSDWTPKLAATYIHNMTTILADTGTMTPGALNYTISGTAPTVHDLLLQKSDGTFYLAVWNERVVGTGTDSVTVNLGGAYSSVEIYDPVSGTSPVQTLSGVNAVPLSLTDHPVLIAVSGLGNIPSPWASQDVGAVGLAGNASYANGTFTVNGCGDDIRTTADSFHSVFQQITGDCTITARLISQDTLHSGALSGVMIRSDLTAGSPNMFTGFRRGSGACYSYRKLPAGTTTRVIKSAFTLPGWIRITRVGNVFKGYTSPDGTTWTQIGSQQTITMGSTVQVGLVHCSADNVTLGTSEYDSVTVTTP